MSHRALRPLTLVCVLSACGGTNISQVGGDDVAIDAPADAPPVECSTPVTFQYTIPSNGQDRDLYAAYANPDTVPDQACSLHTSATVDTDPWDVMFSFLSGSPGFTIDGRGRTELLTADPPSIAINTTAGASSANALEDQLITLTFQHRIYPDDPPPQTPPRVWTMKFKLDSNGQDATAANWHVDLFELSSAPGQ